VQAKARIRSSPLTGGPLLFRDRLMRQQADGAVLIPASLVLPGSGSQAPARLRSSPFIIPSQPMPSAVSKSGGRASLHATAAA
jgi:hypothetical protein